MKSASDGPREVDNHCYGAHYTGNGYEFAFAEQCSATLDPGVLGAPTGEATSISATVEVTYLSAAESASTVGLWCFYDRAGSDWARGYTFIVSPDGTHSILRWMKGARAGSVIAESSHPASSIKTGNVNTIEADCTRSANSLLLVLSINRSETLQVEDRASDSATATFGDAAIAIAGATPGFRAAVRNFKVSALQPTR